MTHDEWLSQVEAEYAAEVERGEHDQHCESREHDRLCHCPKRRREARGLTEVPELEWVAPTCLGCGNETEGDADGFDCSTCSVTWDRNGENGEFTDDYGDLIGQTVVTVAVPGGEL